MSKKCVIVLCVFVALFFAVGIVVAQENEAPMTDGEVVAMEATQSDAALAPMDVVDAGNKICPVTGMLVTEPGKYTVEYEGKLYNLCSETCKETFLKDPATYVEKVDAELAQRGETLVLPEVQYPDEKADAPGEVVEAQGEVE